MNLANLEQDELSIVLLPYKSHLACPLIERGVCPVPLSFLRPQAVMDLYLPGGMARLDSLDPGKNLRDPTGFRPAQAGTSRNPAGT